YAIERLVPDGKFQASLLRIDLDDLGGYEIHELAKRHETLARLNEVVVDELVNEFGGLPFVYDILSGIATDQDLERVIFDVQGRKTAAMQQLSSEEWKRVHRRVIEFATLEAATNRLPERSRKLLAQLSVFRRPFPLQALEEGIGATRDEWQP